MGLWEYRNPALPGQTVRQLVVKETTGNRPAVDNLDADDEYHQELRQTGSPHVNHTLVNGVVIGNAVAQDLPAAWNGHIRRLLMEYCPLGDLQGLLETFQRL